MCVAAIVFNPVCLEYLEAMENDNPHGAGIAWLQNGAIQFMKGLKAKDIYQLQTDEVMSYPYLMHYRWATHGDKVPELTHPFPIGPRALLGELSGSAQAVLIHNGTWNSYERTAARYINLGNYEIPEEILAAASDTAVAAWLVQDNPEILDEISWATAVAEIVEKDGAKSMEITTRGTWSDKDGNWYSNLNWVPWSGYNSFPSYFEDDASLWKRRSAYWEEWTRRYEAGESTEDLVHPEARQMVPAKDPTGAFINWDEYYKHPFALASAEDKALGFDAYTERFRYDNLKKAADAARTSSSGEMSWDDFLVARYGEKAAAEIKATHFPEDENGDGNGDILPLSLICGYSAANGCEDDFDPDTVSEDFETVNAILERQSRNRSVNGW